MKTQAGILTRIYVSTNGFCPMVLGFPVLPCLSIGSIAFLYKCICKESTFVIETTEQRSITLKLLNMTSVLKEFHTGERSSPGAVAHSKGQRESPCSGQLGMPRGTSRKGWWEKGYLPVWLRFGRSQEFF